MPWGVFFLVLDPGLGSPTWGSEWLTPVGEPLLYDYSPVCESPTQGSVLVQSCLTLCNRMDCSLPSSFAHGIFQARILEWVAISYFSGSSPSRDLTQGSNLCLLHLLSGDCLPLAPPGKPYSGIWDLIISGVYYIICELYLAPLLLVSLWVLCVFSYRRTFQVDSGLFHRWLFCR